jgi:hypothetical protein
MKNPILSVMAVQGPQEGQDCAARDGLGTDGGARL